MYWIKPCFFPNSLSRALCESEASHPTRHQLSSPETLTKSSNIKVREDFRRCDCSKKPLSFCFLPLTQWTHTCPCPHIHYDIVENQALTLCRIKSTEDMTSTSNMISLVVYQNWLSCTVLLADPLTDGRLKCTMIPSPSTVSFFVFNFLFPRKRLLTLFPMYFLLLVQKKRDLWNSWTRFAREYAMDFVES